MKFMPNLTKSLDSGPILITGHTGFKGAWLGLLLRELGIRPLGLSLPPTKNSLYTKISNSHFLREYFEDIRDQKQISRIIEKEKPSIIFHLAAQPLVMHSYLNPRETFEINVMGTVNLLDSFVRVEAAKLFVGVTTDKVYENNETKISFQEKNSLLGKDPYSASKVAAENALIAWRHLMKLEDGPRIISVRAGNVIGGGDFAENRIIPDIVRGTLKNSQVVIRNPQSTRPWQHVLDPLNGYLKAAEYVLLGGKERIFNFGPEGESLSVAALVEIALKSGMNVKQQFEYSGDNSSREAKTLQLDSSLSREVLKWKPRWSQELAIAESFRWWRQVIDKKLTPEEACTSDIDFLLLDLQ
jgi:CDP-glucose 4,6-dehydratase